MKTIEQKAKKVPAIRFASFDDEWVEKKLGEKASFSKGMGYSKGDLKENGTPIVLYGRLYTKYETIISDVDTFADAKSNSVYSKGGEVIVPGSGETAEDISIASVVKKSGVLLGGDLNVITPPKNLDSVFLAISISNGKPHSDMAKMAQGKSVVHLHNTDLAEINLPYPNIIEQQKIGSFFSNIDSLISLEQKKYDKLTQVKKSMLEKMFPKEGTAVPEIRFAGFTGDWEKDEFSNIITVHPFKPYLAEPHIGGKIEVIQQGNDPIAGYANGKPFEDYKNVTLFGDHTVSLYKARNPFFVASDGLKILSSKKTSPNFFYHMLDRFKPIPEGYKRHFMILLERECYYPKEKTEQNLISSYLNSLDSLISLQQRKLEKLKNIKKSLLEKMFV